MEAKKRFINSIRAARHEAGELPTQENPGIDQKQADTQQKETQSRIARGGGSPHTAQDTIAAFNFRIGGDIPGRWSRQSNQDR